MGIKYYRSHSISEKGKPDKDLSAIEALFNYEEHDNPKWEKISGDASWNCLRPEGIGRLLEYINANFRNIPVLITENGCPDNEGADPLRDEHRIRFMTAHIDAVMIARRAGMRLLGYTAWSFLDNFEWDEGIAVRFGLLRVDWNEKNRNRVPKESAMAFARIVASHFSRED